MLRKRKVKPCEQQGYVPIGRVTGQVAYQDFTNSFDRNLYQNEERNLCIAPVRDIVNRNRQTLYKDQQSSKSRLV